jgi:hypothetical protein
MFGRGTASLSQVGARRRGHYASRPARAVTILRFARPVPLPFPQAARRADRGSLGVSGLAGACDPHHNGGFP